MNKESKSITVKLFCSLKNTIWYTRYYDFYEGENRECCD